jgi:hypothetical protein
MRILISLAALVPVAFLSTGAIAQDEKEAPESYIYASYFVCDVTKQDRADEIVRTKDAPVYDAAVKDGTITGWGWLAHHTGIPAASGEEFFTVVQPAWKHYLQRRPKSMRHGTIAASSAVSAIRMMTMSGIARRVAVEMCLRPSEAK